MDTIVNTAELEARIESVFRDVAPPRADALLHPESRDPTAVEPFETWRAWQEIPADFLRAHYDGLSFFGPAAFRFFLPAFLRVTLRLFTTSDAFVSDATVYELNPSSDCARSRFADFTGEECVVVAAFLECMVAHPDHADVATAQAALDGFWADAAARGT